MSTKMEQLIVKLDEMNEKFEPSPNNHFFEPTGSGYDDDMMELSGEIECLACELLIESGGKPNYTAMEELDTLSENRYTVEPGETDGFGWLTGVIVSSKGKIVYG